MSWKFNALTPNAYRIAGTGSIAIFTADICLFGLEVATERNCGTSDFDKVDVDACVAAAQRRNFHWE